MRKHPDSTIGGIFYILKGISIHPAYLLIPIILGMASAASEGISIGLLSQLLQGFLIKDFSFIQGVPMIGPTLAKMAALLGSSSDKNLFAILLSIFVVATVLKNILRYSSQISMSYFAERAMHHLRKTVFAKYLSFGKLYFDRTSIGHHATVLSDCISMGLSPLVNFPKYMNAFFSFVVYLGIMFFISWELTLFAVPFFAILHICVSHMIRRIRHSSVLVTERGMLLGKKSVEVLSILPLVKAYGTEVDERKSYSKVSDEKAHIDFRSMCVQQMILPLQEFLTLLAAAILFAFMMYLLVQDKNLTSSLFMIYFYIIVNASSKFGTLTGFRGSLARASGALHEILKVFDPSDKEFIPDGSRKFDGLKKEIEFRHLTFSYSKDRRILDDISFSIERGKMTAIVGPTGSGKTTLIHLLMRLYDCPSESIFIDGVDIREFGIHSLLQHVALVSQDSFLIHDTLRNNITYGLTDISDQEVADAVKRSRLDMFVKDLPQGVDTLIGDRGVKLSGGEKQRVSIARALLKKSEILILDEATSSLDSATERLIQEAIDEAVRGRTSIVIAHRLSTIQHADAIVVIDNGRVAEQGTLQQLLVHKGTFHHLWEQQKFH